MGRFFLDLVLTPTVLLALLVVLDMGNGITLWCQSRAAPQAMLAEAESGIPTVPGEAAKEEGAGSQPGTILDDKKPSEGKSLPRPGGKVPAEGEPAQQSNETTSKGT